ncbi:hypothetical protein AMATHDRAFT_77615 [Amanita thiersii Skay4041]|uniref:Uncharacterized protein n=1 Tax=Amanita thiersii Skay4041 TaxID=703135 RepID=A0A2A9NFR4_9AGAR|nr:hypothetical protein AMATHDRAFT_77615 [Amanita thiersii Skay4041]
MSLAFVHAHDCSEPHSDAVWGIAYSQDDTVFSISADGSIKHWMATGQPALPNNTVPPPHTLGLVSLSISPDGQRALYNSIEGLTSLWDVSKNQVVGKHESYIRKQDHLEPSWSVSLNPTSETYASTGGSGNVAILSAKPDDFGHLLTTLSPGRIKFGLHCSHSPDGKRVALASEAGQIYMFDLEANSLATTFTSHAMGVRSLAWSYDSNLLLSASEDKRLILHDVRTAHGGMVAAFTGHSSWVLSVDLSPDGRLGLSGSADKTIRVWDISARAAVSTIQETGEVWSVAWRPKPPTFGTVGSFITGGEDGVVKWWRGAGTGGP